MSYLKEFRKRHRLDDNINVSHVQIVIECVYEAHQIAIDFIASLENLKEEDSFVLHTHFNIIGRIFEHVEGILVCVATECFTSSEALGRVVVESSTNLMYMSTLGNEKTIVAFFNTWIEEHSRKLNEWKQTIQGQEHGESVEPMINERLKVVAIYEEYVKTAIEKFDIDKNDFPALWPKSLFKRFKALGKEESYYTSYHRLSGASHITAEDTMSWLICLPATTDHKQALAQEAVWYSIMMSRISCSFFIDALIICCVSKGLRSGNHFDRLKELSKFLKIAADELAMDVGVPR